MRRLGETARGLGFGAGSLQFGFDVGETRAFGEPAGSTGRRMRRGGKAIPTPEIAFWRYQTLAGLQLRGKARTGFLVDDADLPQAAAELGRRLNM